MRDLSVHIFGVETEAVPSVAGAVCLIVLSIVLVYSFSLSALMDASKESKTIPACGFALVWTMFSHVVVYPLAVFKLGLVFCAVYCFQNEALVWFRRTMGLISFKMLIVLGLLAIYYSSTATSACIGVLNNVSFTPGTAALVNLGYTIGALDIVIALIIFGLLAKSFYSHGLEGYTAV